MEYHYNMQRGAVIRITIVCIALLFLLLRGGDARAQERSRAEHFVHFRVNRTQIEPEYMSNADRITELVSFLQRLQGDSTVSITNISFCGTASPEGSYEYNKMLAKGRREALEQWVRSRVALPDSIVTYQDDYIPWEYLSSLVAESDISHKEAILDILDKEEIIVRYYRDRRIDDRVLRLRALDGGKVWREMHKRFFKPLRNACVIFVTFEQTGVTDTVRTYHCLIPPMPSLPEFAQPSLLNTLPSDMSDTLQVVLPDSVALPSVTLWQRTVSVKSNLLGWGLAITNAAVEADLCPYLSFHLPVYYSAWNYFTPTVKFRTFALQPEVRYWFSTKRLCNDGWFAGAHFGLAYYNVATAGEYRTQDHDGTCPALGGGLAVGYRLPISKGNRWKLEVSLGAGIYGLHYDLFRNIPNGLLVSTEKKTYIGIDRAAISLSYTFGLKRKERAL